MKTGTNKSYASTVTAQVSSAPALSNTVIEKDTTTKIMSCMMHAHLINAVNPGTYNTELNRTLKLNNLPTINLPNDPPSKEIMSLVNTNETVRNKEHHQENEPNNTQASQA